MNSLPKHGNMPLMLNSGPHKTPTSQSALTPPNPTTQAINPSLLRRLASNTFLRHNLIFFCGSLLVAFLNYLYYPVLGHLLTPADFGEVQAIISLFLQAGVFLQVLGIVTVGIFRKYDDPAHRRRLVRELEWLALIIGGGLLIVVALASPALQAFLKFQSLVPFLLFALATFLGISLAVSNSYLQGAHKFGQLAWSNIVGAASKLVASAAFVLVGLRATGAILGVLLAQVINFGYTHWLARRLGRPDLQLRRSWPHLALIGPELRYAGLVLAVSLCVNVILSVDIITVKHYFSPHDAGLYAGIATIARIIFFLTAPLAAVLVASVKLGQPDHNRSLLIRSLALVAVLGAGCLVIFTAAPQTVIRLLVGNQYLDYARQLPRLGLAIFVLSVANLLLYYQMAQRQARAAITASLGLVAMGVLLFWQHQTIVLVVNSLIEGSFCLLILVSVTSLWSIISQRRAKPSPTNP